VVVLRNVIVSEYITFYQINKFSVITVFFIIGEVLYAERVKWLRVSQFGGSCRRRSHSTGPISLLIKVKTEYPSEIQVLHGVLIRGDI